MTINHDFKLRVRERMARTGERYTTARAHLLGGIQASAPAGRVAGRTPETAAVAQALRRLGAVAPHQGQPWSEAALFGLAGGIGMAYFTFAYAQTTTLFVGGRINEFVLGRDFMESMLARAGVPVTVQTTAGGRTAERQLRAALDAGHPAIAVIDRTLVPESGLPPDLVGTMPYPVLVALSGDAPQLTDALPGVSYPTSWKDLAAARAAYRPGKHRLLVFDRAPQPVTATVYEAAVRAAVNDTVRGMVDPPRSNFGLTGFDRWAAALSGGAKDGWARLFGDGGGLVDALSWLVFWIEGAGTGGGAYRALYADFLDEAAAALGSDVHAQAARAYRDLAEQWRVLAGTAAVDDVKPAAAQGLRQKLADRVRLLGADERVAVRQLEQLV